MPRLNKADRAAALKKEHASIKRAGAKAGHSARTIAKKVSAATARSEGSGQG